MVVGAWEHLLQLRLTGVNAAPLVQILLSPALRRTLLSLCLRRPRCLRRCEGSELSACLANLSPMKNVDRLLLCCSRSTTTRRRRYVKSWCVYALQKPISPF